MHYLYILYSKKIDRFYVGETPDIDLRVNLHNSHYFKKSFTNSSSDWEIVLDKRCKDRGEALYLENFIKRMKSKKFIEKIIVDPKILDDIVHKR